MSDRTRRDIEELIRDGEVLDRAMVAARRRLILEHRLRGVPLAVWRDETVVEISPFSIELPEEEPALPPR